MNAALARLHLPPVQGSTLISRRTPSPAARHLESAGLRIPDIPGNSAQAYYPGDHFVDVVGDDLYDIRGKAEWPAADALYRAHPSKPFAFPEWGLWGLDDPALRPAHARLRRSPIGATELVAYFESVPGSVFDLATKPALEAATGG